MSWLKLRQESFPESEVLQYSLSMVGAKGGLRISSKRTAAGQEIRCQMLASLILPPKKIVDSEIVSVLAEDVGTGEMRLVRHTDSDFKSEARRTLELKQHGIETRYTKFDEERGYIDYPAEAALSEIVDPLSALFVVRSPEFLSGKSHGRARILVRTGVIEVGIMATDERRSWVEALEEERSLLRVELSKIGAGEIKGPYFSKDIEVWLDRETGIVTEVAYPFLGSFGKAALNLTEVKK